MSRAVRLVLVGAVLVASCAFAAPAGAFIRTCDTDRPCNVGNQIVLTGQVIVTETESAKSVVILDGDVQVDGRVRDTVFAINGDVLVRGRVDDEVISLNGRVRVADGGFVGGDVVSRKAAIINEGATVRGSVDKVEGRFALGQLAWVGRIVLWIALTVSVFVLGAVLILVAPRALEAAANAGRTAVGPAIGLGFAVGIGLPVAGVLLLVSLVGLPLGIGLLLALALLYAIGYTAGAFFLGRLIVPDKSPWLAFLAGWGILRVVDFVPVLGSLVGFAATVYGLGMLTVALFRARKPASAGPDSTEIAGVSVS